MLLLGILSGCGHWHKSAGHGYRHAGSEFKTPSDYAFESGDGSERPPVTPTPLPRRSINEFRVLWPVSQVKINRGFRTGSGPDHQGIDLGGPLGAPILAAHEGRVIYTGHEFHGYGNMIMVEYDNEWATLYGHLSKIQVKTGARVEPGQVIGRMGKSGHATGVHLHFELMHQHQPVDPLHFLTQARMD